MTEAGAASRPQRDARLVLGLAVLAFVFTPARVLALTAQDFPNFGYCTDGKRTTDLKKCKSKAARRPGPARAKRPFR